MQSSLGEFLKQKRQEKNLTQKDLASRLFVSESAVSKWERGVAHPDITLLPKICGILGVTEHELITASVDNEVRQEKSQAKKWRNLTATWNLFFYISYAVALLVCFICNIAVNKTLSWFWIVLSALILAFTFTNLPKLINKNKLILLPLSMFLALCLLLGVCAIYTNGGWFFIATLSVFLGLIIIFLPIYIAKYKIFERVRKCNDFISVAVDFIVLNILLLVIENYSGITWYFNVALPIVLVIYLLINLLLCVKFININKLLKTSIILSIIETFIVLLPLFIKSDNFYVQKEIDDFNIFKANFNVWIVEQGLDNNIACLIAITMAVLIVVFLISGLITKNKNNALKQEPYKKENID